jgi:hypothetical protein
MIAGRKEAIENGLGNSKDGCYKIENFLSGLIGEVIKTYPYKSGSLKAQLPDASSVKSLMRFRILHRGGIGTGNEYPIVETSYLSHPQNNTFCLWREGSSRPENIPTIEDGWQMFNEERPDAVEVENFIAIEEDTVDEMKRLVGLVVDSDYQVKEFNLHSNVSYLKYSLDDKILSLHMMDWMPPWTDSERLKKQKMKSEEIKKWFASFNTASNAQAAGVLR